MKVLFRLFFYVLVLLLPCSCLYKKMYHLQEGDDLWIEAYDEGDSVLFLASDSNDVDTVIIAEKIYHEKNDPRALVGVSDEFHANVGFFMDMIHKGNYDGGNYMIFWRANDSVGGVCFNICWNNHVFGNQKDICFKTDTIAGCRYDDIIKICNERKCATAGYYFFEFFLWSKSKGLMRYKYIDGDTYTLYKKIPAKK